MVRLAGRHFRVVSAHLPVVTIATSCRCLRPTVVRSRFRPRGRLQFGMPHRPTSDRAIVRRKPNATAPLRSLPRRHQGFGWVTPWISPGTGAATAAMTANVSAHDLQASANQERCIHVRRSPRDRNTFHAGDLSAQARYARSPSVVHTWRDGRTGSRLDGRLRCCLTPSPTCSS